MTGTAIVLREECSYFSLLSVTTCHYQTIASFMSLKYIFLDTAPLELIISLQYAVIKLSNHEHLQH